jgi:predicted nucleic acid-binding protein
MEPQLWADAYLAASAAVNDTTLVTFDKGFPNTRSKP